MSSTGIDIGLPEKIELVDHGSYIEIVRTWFGKRYVIIAAIAVFWNGFLVSFYGRLPPDAHLMAFLFPLIHVGVGVGLIYSALAGFFNHTHIFVSPLLMEVRHRPLPWLGNKKVDATELKQLYAKDKISKSHDGDGVGRTTVTYEVRAVTNGGQNIRIVGGLATQEQALAIEQQIEKYLKLKDAPVPGEVRKY